jgi:hypothetical protein
VERLTWTLASEKRIRLHTTTLDATKLRASEFPVCWLTGTDAPVFTATEQTALLRYLQTGGTLIIDAAGSNKPMSDWFERFAEKVSAPGGLTASEEKQLLAMDPYLLPSVRYTPAAANKLIGSQRRKAQLDVLRIGKRPAVFFSHIDLTASLVGYPLGGLEAYHPDDAKALLANLIANLSPK